MDKQAAVPSVAGDRVSVGELSPLLNASVIAQIEEALCRVGEFGEVRLIVNKGRLRFIQVTRSESVHEA